MSSEQPDVAPPTADRVTRRRLRPRVWVALGIAVVVLVGVGAGTFFLLRPANNTRSGGFTQQVQASLGTQTATVSFDGTLAPKKESDLDFSVSGTVTSVSVKAGQKVKKGQKLATIDSTDLKNAVSLASANLSAAQANLTEVKDADGSSAAIRSAKAQVTSAAASLSSAEQNLNGATLKAPVAGTVAAVNIEVGDTTGSSSSSSSSNAQNSSTTSTTSTSSAAITIISTSSWKVEGTVGAADLGSLKAGQAATITTDAASSALKGTVTSVGIVATSTSDDGTAAFPIVVTLSGSHKNLYSGTTASVVVTTGTYQNVLTVPTAAITTENGKTVVTKVDGSSTQTVEVAVGKVFGNETQITSGLTNGDTVQIRFVPRSQSTSSSSGQQGGFGGGFGGIGGGLGGGGGAPPGGGGAAGGVGGGR